MLQFFNIFEPNFDINNFKLWLTSLYSRQSSNMLWKAKAFCIRLYFSSNSFKFVQQTFKNESFGDSWRVGSMRTTLRHSLNWSQPLQTRSDASPGSRSPESLKTSPGSSECAFSGAALIWSIFWNDVITTYWIRFSIFFLYKPKCQWLKLMFIAKQICLSCFFELCDRFLGFRFFFCPPRTCRPILLYTCT